MSSTKHTLNPPSARPGREPLRHGRGLARALSKLGFCSRSRAVELVVGGHVRVNGILCRQLHREVDLSRDRLEVDGKPLAAARKVYLMLNKPRGVLTTASDEQGRGTVFDCLPSELSFLAPVGRLDKASEGLLLFTNDTQWAARLTDPARHVEKTYHVQIDRVADERLLEQILNGVTQEGDLLAAKRVALLRSGTRNSWLEIVLDEGKNRQIRRMLEVLETRVLRLVRVAIGRLQLGELPKGECRFLTGTELNSLGS